MRYIKSINEYNIVSGLYYHIPEEEWMNLVDNYIINIEEDKFDLLSNIFIDDVMVELEKYNGDGRGITRVHVSTKDKIFVMIYQIPDEYFIIALTMPGQSTLFFKCDTIDGIIQLIKNKLPNWLLC